MINRRMRIKYYIFSALKALFIIAALLLLVQIAAGNELSIRPDGSFSEKLPASRSITETEELPININAASLRELKKLSGIGEAKAAAIIAYREKNGGFSSVDEITRVSGIGEATLDKIRDKITV